MLSDLISGFATESQKSFSSGSASELLQSLVLGQVSESGTKTEQNTRKASLMDLFVVLNNMPEETRKEKKQREERMDILKDSNQREIYVSGDFTANGPKNAKDVKDTKFKFYGFVTPNA
jgi:hypothetical protein